MQGMFRRLVTFATLLVAGPALAADLPKPPKGDVPYVIHATSLMEIEVNQAGQEETKKETIFHVPGTNSTARTPLGFPEFLFAPESIDPRTLQLFEMTPGKGRREILYRKKKKILAQPLILEVQDTEMDGVVKIRVKSPLRPGEYCLTPDGTNDVFCFAVT